MIIRFDENISRRIVEAIRSLGPSPDLILEHPSERAEAGRADVDWISEFAARGGRCVVSGDEKMRNRPPERAALQAAGLVAIFPPESRFWKPLLAYGQAAFLIRWFRVIEEITRNAEPGAHFRLPAIWTNITPDAVITLKMIGEDEG